MFETTVKRLLLGEFICEVTADECYRYLKHAEHRHEVETYLEKLGYALSCTANHLAYFAAYRRIDAEARSDIRRIFQTFRLELQPVVEWLDMMMQCQRQDATLSPGDTLSFSGLLKTIENNQALAERLQNFARYKDFLSNDDSIKGRLEKLLKTLNHWGYLHLASRDTLVYQVTGKLDYFYQALQFILEHEELPLEQKEDEVQQGELF